MKNENEIKVNYPGSMGTNEDPNSVHTGDLYTHDAAEPLPEILFISSFPPRECGIATYSQDLIKALNNKFDHSFNITLCPLESDSEKHSYPEEVKFILNTDHPASFISLATLINDDANIRMVMIQHEFGLFKNAEDDLRKFLAILSKPVIMVFHTVLAHPDEILKEKVQYIVYAAESIIVMTRFSAKVLVNDYGVARNKITIIPHGTHLVQHVDKDILKAKYNLSGKKILATFGLLSSGKSIETTLDALPAIIKQYPDVLFLIIGKTHPSVVKQEGERYRVMLEDRVNTLRLQQHVLFINSFLPLPELLEYLQLTDIYLFTSKDPNQAVSGTFSFAISCGCPVISTPIPHAKEVLKKETGVIIDFEDPKQLAKAVISLFNDEQLRKNMSLNGLHRMASTAWENAAIAHAMLFEKTGNSRIALHYKRPVINLEHIKKLTTDFGMIQFSKINQPDIDSGYTLDDNARAMVAMCQHFEVTGDKTDVDYIRIYLAFIKYCQQYGGHFLNYVNGEKEFTEQNYETNLEDSNGRAVWALGYLVSMADQLAADLKEDAAAVLQTAIPALIDMNSTRAMAFTIKGLYYSNTKVPAARNISLINKLADRLVQMYRHEAEGDWQWFESYLTYANSILPEALLCAWLATGKASHKEIASSSFHFLLSKTFNTKRIKVISNKNWLHKEIEPVQAVIGGEQPIDVAYTIIALSKFYEVFKDEAYKRKMEMAFNWFLGANHLHQVIYNPCTGGCYDGLEENYVNLNQGAESTVSYLMARVTIEMLFRKERIIKHQKKYFLNPTTHDQHENATIM